MARQTLQRVEREPERSVKFLPTGSTNLNLALSSSPKGGWARGRIVNIIGDKSSGKSLLGIEACANFATLYDPERVRYVEAEAAWDDDYAETIGMPGEIELERNIHTVEAFYKDLKGFLGDMGSKDPSLYILDSLDALSDNAEMKAEIDEGSYGTAKARKMSELFRRITAEVENSDCCLIIISQVRSKIGVTFGERTTRSGGRALDFYASQILKLAELQKVTRTIRSVKRVVGLDVRASVRKNKVAPPYRETAFTILFNYGVDDEASMLDWLKANKGKLPLSEAELTRRINAAHANGNREALKELNKLLADAITQHWQDIERDLMPTMRKYG